MKTAFAEDLPYRIRERLVHLDGEVKKETLFWPFREKPNLIVQSHPRILDIRKLTQPLPKPLQLFRGDINVVNLDANAWFSRTTRGDHFPNKFMKSLLQVILVRQLIADEISSGVTPWVSQDQGQDLSLTLILSHIPQGSRRLRVFLEHRHQDSVGLADSIG